MGEAPDTKRVPPCPQLDGLWDFEKPQLSEQRFADAALEAHAENDPQCELEALTQKARALGLQRRFDDAHATLDEVNQRLNALTDEGRVPVRLDLERGRVFNSSGDSKKAVPHFLRAFELSKQLGDDGLTIDAAHMVAIAVSDDPDAALEWNLRALELAEATKAEAGQRWLGSLYNNIGFTYFDREQFDEAMTYFERGVEFRKRDGKQRPLLIAHWTVARTLRAKGQLEEALLAQHEILLVYARADLEPTGYVFEEIGECLLALGRTGYPEHFRKAYEALSKDPWFVDNEPQRLARIKRLSEE